MNTVPQNEVFGRAVDFYQSLVNYQFAIVGVLLVVGFISSFFISREQVREQVRKNVDEVFDSEYFQAYNRQEADKIGRGIMTELFNNNKIYDHLQNLGERVGKLEEGSDQYESDKYESDKLEINPLSVKPQRSKPSKSVKPRKKTVKKKEMSDGND